MGSDFHFSCNFLAFAVFDSKISSPLRYKLFDTIFGFVTIFSVRL